jgi:hypothetical protein
MGEIILIKRHLFLMKCKPGTEEEGCGARIKKESNYLNCN